MTWKPPIPWTVQCSRGAGEARVTMTFRAASYLEAVALRRKILARVRPHGVPPWDVVWVREHAVPTKRKATPRNPSRKRKPTLSYPLPL